MYFWAFQIVYANDSFRLHDVAYKLWLSAVVGLAPTGGIKIQGALEVVGFVEPGAQLWAKILKQSLYAYIALPCIKGPICLFFPFYV